VAEGLNLEPAHFWRNEEAALNDFKNQSLLLILFQDHLAYTELTVKYYERYKEGSTADFSFTREQTGLVRQGPRLGLAAFAASVLIWARAFSISRYRRGRQAEYHAWQRKQTEEVYELKKLLDESRKLARAGKDAQALVLINRLLEQKPSYDEAAELKRLILSGVGATRATLIGGSHVYDPDGQVSADVPNLFLKILQTPYAYRAPRGFDRITLGRQRRQNRSEGNTPNPENEVGNDLVIRVPGSDRLSLRISRKHMEINRIHKEFFIKDLSGGRTLLNGRRLAKGVPYPILAGDRLTLAGVLVLQVQIQIALGGQVVGKIIQLQQKRGSTFEATIGDMVTELPDE
jgi:hypothetical protein